MWPSLKSEAGGNNWLGLERLTVTQAQKSPSQPNLLKATTEAAEIATEGWVMLFITGFSHGASQHELREIHLKRIIMEKTWLNGLLIRRECHTETKSVSHTILQFGLYAALLFHHSADCSHEEALDISLFADVENCTRALACQIRSIRFFEMKSQNPGSEGWALWCHKEETGRSWQRIWKCFSTSGLSKPSTRLILVMKPRI